MLEIGHRVREAPRAARLALMRGVPKTGIVLAL